MISDAGEYLPTNGGYFPVFVKLIKIRLKFD